MSTGVPTHGIVPDREPLPSPIMLPESMPALDAVVRLQRAIQWAAAAGDARARNLCRIPPSQQLEALAGEFEAAAAAGRDQLDWDVL